MAALISVLFATTLSLLITRVGSEALNLTGLSRASANFQAGSAFTGAGFTTAESEAVVSHPVRRRIIMLLMFLGNAGVITIVSSLVITFVSASSMVDRLFHLLYLLIGFVILWLVATNSAFNRLLTRIVRRALRRWTDINLHDYDKLLHLRDDYEIIKIKVDDYNDWLANKTLQELKLRDRGITVLGIERIDLSYEGTLMGDTCIYSGDSLIVYTHKSSLLELELNRQGIDGNKVDRQSAASAQHKPK